MALADGMPDLGNLADRVKAVRNKKTGVVVTRDHFPTSDELGEGQEHPWVPIVRRAYNHTDELEMLEYIPGKDDPKVRVLTQAEGNDLPVLEDGTSLTKESLTNLHYKTLTKVAKTYGFKPEGKTKAQIIAGTLKAAYGDAGLEIPPEAPIPSSKE